MVCKKIKLCCALFLDLLAGLNVLPRGGGIKSV